MIFKADKEGKGNRLKNAFFVKCMFNLFQFDHLKYNIESVLKRKLYGIYILYTDNLDFS